MNRHHAVPAVAFAMIVLPAALLSGGTARAESPCASPYVVQPGDTLYQITRQCRVRLDALRQANPELGDRHRIAVGTRIRIPGAAGEEPEEAPVGDSYTVRPGDTMFSIAQAHGVELAALMAANPYVDPADMAIGLTLALPGGDAGAPDHGSGDRATISVEPLAGAPGTRVTVRGEHYRPGSIVTVGWGPPASEWERLERARADAGGSVSALVEIPPSAEPGRQIVFVIDSGTGITRVSERFNVVQERDPDEPGDGDADVVTVEGRISQGVECPVIETRNGRLYALTGAGDFDSGDYVRVTGTIADMSICMQGEGTISVRTMTEVPPPDGRGGD